MASGRWNRGGRHVAADECRRLIALQGKLASVRSPAAKIGDVTAPATNHCFEKRCYAAKLRERRNVICRICGDAKARELGDVEYYVGFSWMIYECSRCLCRFTKHDDAIYQWLHSHAQSSYGLYVELANEYKKLFDQHDVSTLKRELCKTSKYRFVIDAAQELPESAKLLEIGCSRGYLACYFIRCGFDILGTDVSAEAVSGAKAAFGHFFEVADSAALDQRAPYDLIYHVGTIGCVRDPVALTHRLLNLLKPGGRLLFNAPNVHSCWLKGQLWIDEAPPPDVVTLYAPGFWCRQFSSVADVIEQIERYGPEQALRTDLRKLFGRKWQKPMPIPLERSLPDFKGARGDRASMSTRLWSYFERAAIKLGRISGTVGLARSPPSPFGLFVTMTKR